MAAQLRANLPKMVDAVTSAGQVVTWVCDPMHGNTECVAGYKTRRYDNIRAEVMTPPAFRGLGFQVTFSNLGYKSRRYDNICAEMMKPPTFRGLGFSVTFSIIGYKTHRCDNIRAEVIVRPPCSLILSSKRNGYDGCRTVAHVLSFICLRHWHVLRLLWEKCPAVLSSI